MGCLLDRLVIADQLEDITLWVADVQGPPTTPTVFSRGDVNSQVLQASQFGVKVILVDFEREMMQRRRLDMNRFASILWEGRRQRLVEQADDLRVASISIRHLEEGDPVGLAQDVEANDLGVEALDALEILHSEHGLAQGSYSRIHQPLGPLMTNDVEVLILSGRLEIGGDCIELSFRGPGGAGRQRFASLPQLTLAEIIGSVYEVQLVFDVGALNEPSKPLALRPSVAGKVEDDRHSPRQEILDEARQGGSHSGGAFDEVLDAENFVGIQCVEEFVLNHEDGVLRASQIPRVSRLPRGHLPTHEVQPRSPLSHLDSKGLT